MPFCVPPAAVVMKTFCAVVGNKVVLGGAVVSGTTVVKTITPVSVVVRGTALMLVAMETISVAAGTGRVAV